MTIPNRNCRLAAALALLAAMVAAAQNSNCPNPTVELIRRAKPAIVPIFSFGTNDTLNSGAGAVIHPSGFILTADHVTRDKEGVALFGLTREPYRVIGRLPEKDLALLKVAAPQPRAFLPLGRSSAVCEGETVLAIGNPGGRGIVFSQGIVSCASIDPTWPNVLSQAYWNNGADAASGRDDFIQFDAAVNHGNSGGPLINAAGELIGVVAMKKNDEEAINWAVPVDRARRFFNYMVQPEEVEGFWTGIEVDLLAPRATVTAAAENSPAASAGLAPGDVLLSLDEMNLRNGPDWLLALTGHKPGNTVALQVERAGASRKASLTLAPYPLPAAISKKGKSPGLRFSVYRPEAAHPWHKIPNFSALKPVQEGSLTKLSPDEFVRGSKDNYAVAFQGYLEFPKAGHYRVILASDDGSKCYLNNRLVLDNDFGHPPLPLSRSVRVPAGLTPIRIEYFNGRGGRALTLQIMEMDKSGQPVSEAAFYRD
ncbi:MAG TPA: trypsin-like peptidase domain-containing protein [Bacillota bacterium]|nr:trypsin-like peptidase domain-containing protein [Bacillota bacterium]